VSPGTISRHPAILACSATIPYFANLCSFTIPRPKWYCQTRFKHGTVAGRGQSCLCVLWPFMSTGQSPRRGSCAVVFDGSHFHCGPEPRSVRRDIPTPGRFTSPGPQVHRAIPSCRIKLAFCLNSSSRHKRICTAGRASFAFGTSATGFQRL